MTNLLQDKKSERKGKQVIILHCLIIVNKFVQKIF